MAKDITSANAVIMFAIAGLFPAPQQLQEFAVDDIFTTEEIQTTENQMGVDGFMATGHVNVPVPQTFAFLASSVSCAMFDQWRAQQKVGQTVFWANATVLLPALGLKWTCTGGALQRAKPMPDAQRVLGMRRFGLLWESVLPAPG
ncbi:MAG TPA: hypothetical protein VIU44_08110 [Gaiellaceae bacterium]